MEQNDVIEVYQEQTGGGDRNMEGEVNANNLKLKTDTKSSMPLCRHLDCLPYIVNFFADSIDSISSTNSNNLSNSSVSSCCKQDDILRLSHLGLWLLQLQFWFDSKLTFFMIKRLFFYTVLLAGRYFPDRRMAITIIWQD